MIERKASLALALAFTVALPAGLAAQEGRFGESASVVAVEVPVYVTKDGKPVRGLTAADFEVLDGKTRREITGFEVVDLAALPDAPAPAGSGQLPLAARRHFLLLFDLTFAQPASIVQARRAAQELVRTRLHPSDLVAVATYSGTAGATLVLGFTPDRAQAEAAIESLGVPQLLARHPDPLTLYIADLKSTMGGSRQAGARFGAGGGSSSDKILLDILEDMQRLIAPERRALENQVVALTRSFTDLAQMMGSIDGRKLVLYLSEGFEASVSTGSGLGQEAADTVTGGKFWKVDSEDVYGNTRVQNDLANMLESMRRADCVIQAVDIGRVRAAGTSAASERSEETLLGLGGRDSLLTLAHGTGGELYQGYNDLGAAIEKMLERTGVTYLLSFAPADLVHDGAFHPLQVRLKGGPRGARAHHRAGYYAPDPRRAADPRERRLADAAALLGGGDEGTLPLSILALGLPSPAAGSVPLLLEVDGPALLAGHLARQMEVEIYAYAFDRDQAVRGFLTQHVDIDLDKREAELRASGLKFYGDLELPPGEYSLRVLVRNTATGARVLRTVPLQVPPAAAAPLALPPFFPEPPGGWVLAREDRRGDDAEPSFPFMLAGQPFLPALHPVLAAGAEVPVALLVYNLAAEQAQVRSTVLDATGRPVAGGKLSISAWRRGDGGAPGQMQGSFTSAGLAPGEYLLRVTITDPESGAAHTSSAPFMVGAATTGS